MAVHWPDLNDRTHSKERTSSHPIWWKSCECVSAYLHINGQKAKPESTETDKLERTATNKQTNKRTNERTNKRTNEQTNRQTSKHTNKQTHNSIHVVLRWTRFPLCPPTSPDHETDHGNKNPVWTYLGWISPVSIKVEREDSKEMSTNNI